MILRNNSPKKRKIHYKIDGVPKSIFIGAGNSLYLPEITSKEQINLNSHEEAISHYFEKFGINFNTQIEIITNIVLSANSFSTASFIMHGVNYAGMYYGKPCILSCFSGDSVTYSSTIKTSIYEDSKPPVQTTIYYRDLSSVDWEYVSGTTLTQRSLSTIGFNTFIVSEDLTPVLSIGDTITFYGGLSKIESYKVTQIIFNKGATEITYNFPANYDKMTIFV